MDVNKDQEEMDDDEIANYIVYYACDDCDVFHYLDVLDYSTDLDASVGSWYVWQ